MKNNNQISHFDERCLIIKIRDSHPNVYDRVRRCWRISINKAKQTDYVLAVIKGRVEGIYISTKWYAPFDKNCNNKCPNFPCNGKRIGFIGKEADINIQKKYLYKYLPDFYMRSGPGPVLYTY